jgi:hypothetical protein
MHWPLLNKTPMGYTSSVYRVKNIFEKTIQHYNLERHGTVLICCEGKVSVNAILEC